MLDSGLDTLILHLYIFFWEHSIPRPKLVNSFKFGYHDEMTLQVEEKLNCGGKKELVGSFELQVMWL